MSRPSWTLSEAAALCGVSRSTVRRYREDGRFPHAFKDTAGLWKIPTEDLLAVGWTTSASATDVPPEPALGVPTVEPASHPADERIKELERALELERARADAAAALAASYRENITDLRQALRMIEAPKTVPSEHPEQALKTSLSGPAEQAVSVPMSIPAHVSEASLSAPSRSWWRRLVG